MQGAEVFLQPRAQDDVGSERRPVAVVARDDRTGGDVRMGLQYGGDLHRLHALPPNLDLIVQASAELEQPIGTEDSAIPC